jgi:methionine-S-sulfoxide reductase
MNTTLNRTAAVLIGMVALAGSTHLGAETIAKAVAPAAAMVAEQGLKIATFAGGCFWSMETDFDKLDGVKDTTSGFMGGKTANPTYAEVSTGTTGHAESVQVTYDPKVVSYEKLVDYYWHHVDLVDAGGQFCDRGDEYRPVIFVATPEEKQVAMATKAALDKSGRFKQPIAVAIADAGAFTAAEESHQNFHIKHPIYYGTYRIGCGRDARIKELWGQESAAATH